VDTAGKALKKTDAQTGLLGKLRAWVSNTGAGNAHLDPNSALECIAGQTRDSMFILADFGRCLEDPKIARTLREMVMEGRTARTMLVLTAPRISIPAELEGSCEMFDWPDSNEHDIKAVFNQVRKAMEVTLGRPISVDEQAREAILESLKGKSAGRIRFEIARELMKIPS